MKKSAWLVFLTVAVLVGACKGKTGPAGAASAPVTVIYVPATPTPFCSSPASVGTTLVGTSVGNSAFLRLLASRVDLSSPGTALGICTDLGATVANQGRFALYADNGSGAPGHLIMQTNPVGLTAASWNNISLPTDVYLPAGTYWIGQMFSQTTDIYYGSGANGSLYYVGNYGWCVFPDTFPLGSSTSAPALFSVYLKVCP